MFRYKDKYKNIIHSSPQTTSNLKVIKAEQINYITVIQ